MTAVIGTSTHELDRRRELLAELHRIELTLETANVLDRAAGRLANRRVAQVLRECAEERRRIARNVRAGLGVPIA